MDISPEIKELVDRAAGKVHGSDGPVMAALAAVLELHARELAEKIRQEADLADIPGSPVSPLAIRAMKWSADLIDPEVE